MHDVEYEARRCGPEEAQISMKQAHRIIHWARTSLRPYDSEPINTVLLDLGFILVNKRG